MSNLIAKLDSNEYKAFCLWLRECCGMTISELIKLPHTRQNKAYFQFKEEQGEDF